MQILLLAATETEIQPFTAANSKIDVLITGIGVPATIYHLQKRIHQLDYDLVIQAGIAGSFDTGLALAETVYVKQDCFADLGIEEQNNFTPFFRSGLADENEFPFSNGWLINPHAALFNIKLPAVKAITVNTISDSEKQKQQFLKTYHPVLESMEGAALHYVCLQENIPFIQIRSVSNYVGERDRTKWKFTEAIESLNMELHAFINSVKA